MGFDDMGFDDIDADACAAKSEADCGGCEAPTRRDFLRDAAAAVMGALVAVGAPRSASAMTLRWMDASAENGASVSYPLPAADGTQIDKAHQVILVRWQNAVYAFALSCPHQSQALRWDDKAKRFQCPKHKSRYEPDGKFVSGKATRAMDRYTLRREGDTVVVDTAKAFKQDADAAQWSAAVVKV